MDGPVGHRPSSLERTGRPLVVIGDHHAIDRFGGMAGPPANDVAAFVVLIEDVPNRLRLAREVSDRLHRRAVRRRFGKAQDAVLIGTLAGGN